jgi:2-dehydropantoate 2-reductase
MKILCIGAGAIGFLAGGSAAAQGAAVTFLVKPGQESKLSGQIIQIHNQANLCQTTEFNVINTLTSLRPDDDFDYVFIAVKAFDTEQVIKQLKNGHVRFHAILCLQNGVENEDKLHSAFPDADILGASVVSAISRLGDTSIRVEKNRGIGLSGKEEAIQPLFNIFKNTGLNPRIYSDMQAMKWSKMVSNLFSNACSGILDMTPKEIYSRRDLFRIEKAQILEAVAVMQQSGLKIVNLPGLPMRPLIFFMRILPDGILRPLLTKMVAGGRGDKMPSFYIEKMKGSSRSEVNYLNGAVVRKGQAAGVPTPVNFALTEIFNQILMDEKTRQVYSHHPDKLKETIALGQSYIV